MNNQTYIHENVLSGQKNIYKVFLIQKLLGQGISSKVYLGVHEDTKQQFAIKVIPKSYINSHQKIRQLVKTQISILRSCKNQNVIQCYDVFNSHLSIFIVLEYCNGSDMDKYIKSKKYLSQDHAVWHLKQMLNGFKGLHEVGVMHRDFKLANLMLHDRVCKIADLGFAKRMNEEELTNTILGTAMTMAPEVLEQKPYGINADIWSLGVVFYQMLTGQYPYKGHTKYDLIKNIKSGHPINFQNMRISPLAKNFIQGCLTYDPNARMKWIQIYNHPLLNKFTIQLTYGISNTVQIFCKNKQFYKSQSLDDREDSLQILRTNLRKQTMIQDINIAQKEALQREDVYCKSKQLSERSKLLVTYGVNYGMYLNQLSYPMKFIDIKQAETIPNIDHFSPIYLIYKKVYNQLKQLDYIIKKRINILKIQLQWKQFINSSIYADFIITAQTCFQRAQKLYNQAEQALKTLQPPILQYDERMKAQLNEKNVRRKQFTELHDQYKFKYAQNLMKCLMVDDGKQNIDLLQLCQGLIYYIDKPGKDKLPPQRFDWGQSRCSDYKQQRNQVIKKFQLFLGY